MIILCFLIFYSLNNETEIDPETLSNIESNRSTSKHELAERQYINLMMFQQVGIVLTLFFLPFGFSVFHNQTVMKKLKVLFSKNFEKANQKRRMSFSEQLITAYPNLSSYDLRLCEMLHEKLTTKEIALQLNISPSSVNTARYRLRKKMNVPSGIELSVFLRKF